MLGHLFMLRRVDDDHVVFSLAGTEFCDLFSREFRDQNFLSLWNDLDRKLVSAVIEGAFLSPNYAQIGVTGYTLDGRSISAELVMAPLGNKDGTSDRLIGIFQPLEDRRNLYGRALFELAIEEIRPARRSRPTDPHTAALEEQATATKALSSDPANQVVRRTLVGNDR